MVEDKQVSGAVPMKRLVFVGIGFSLLIFDTIQKIVVSKHCPSHFTTTTCAPYSYYVCFL